MAKSRDTKVSNFNFHTYLLFEAQSMVKHDLNNPKVQQNSMVLKEPTC